MRKPKIKNELEYISSFLSQSYPEALDKVAHDEAQGAFETIKESHMELIDALIQARVELITANEVYGNSTALNSSIEQVEGALKKAGAKL